ncbi:MAG: hypothetical protein ACP5VF_13490, partial [Acidobacteriota bacterium]
MAEISKGKAEASEAAGRGRFYVVLHTHWDREWYLPFEEYRVWLTRVVDAALDMIRKGTLEKFVLDGQSVVVEDYLELRPERRDELFSLIRAGKIRVGPWYTQPDEWVPSGESLVRNLLYGLSVARAAGGSSMVGYVPDSFGHVASLPTILRGFGIRTFVFSRGVGEEGEKRKSEFVWRAPDGSSVLAVLLRDGGYCGLNPGALSAELYSPVYAYLPYGRTFSLGAYYSVGRGFEGSEREALLKPVSDLLRALKEHSALRSWPVMIGCDHMPPQRVGEVLAWLRERLGEDLVVADLDEYEKAAQADAAAAPLETYEGELRGAIWGGNLRGYLSTRPDTKRENFNAEAVLEFYAEPLSAVQRGLGGDPVSLDYPWKLLLRSHAHDSACTTGVDSVNDQELERLERAKEAGMALAQRAGDFLAARVSRPAPITGAGAGVSAGTAAGAAAAKGIFSLPLTVVVFNPSNQRRHDLVFVDLPAGTGPIGRAIGDGEGGPAVSEEVDNEKGLQPKATRIAFMADVPAVGYRAYSLEKGDPPASSRGGAVIRNEDLELSLRGDGTLSLRDRRSGRAYDGICLVDSGDVGDEYNHGTPSPDVVVTSAGKLTGSEVVRTPLWEEMRAIYSMPVPKEATWEGRKGKREAGASELVNLEVELRARLIRGTRRAEFEVTVHNNARDHLLRVAFPMEVSELITSTAFAEVRQDLKRDAGRDPLYYNYPFKGWVAAGDGRCGLLLAARGLYESWVEEVPWAEAGTGVEGKGEEKREGEDEDKDEGNGEDKEE